MKTVTINPSKISFPAYDEESLLDSALKSNVTLSYSCKSGSCGICKAKVVSGDVYMENGQHLLTSEELAEGIILTCCSNTLTDCVLEANYFSELAHITRKVVPAKVSKVFYPRNDVAVIHLRLPPTAAFDFLPGQYIDLNFGGIIRSYSIANHSAAGGLELHIRQVNEGAMSGKVFPSLAENTLMRVDGPLGTFFVRKNDRPLIFLVGGTGFAPVKAMIEQLLAEEDKRNIHLYWGGYSRESFYSDLPHRWMVENRHIKYIPVVSGDDTQWKGRLGLVHKAVMEDFIDLSSFDVYACGTPPMISAAQQDFIAQGLPEKHFFADAFVESAHQSKG